MAGLGPVRSAVRLHRTILKATADVRELTFEQLAEQYEAHVRFAMRRLAQQRDSIADLQRAQADFFSFHGLQ